MKSLITCSVAIPVAFAAFFLAFNCQARDWDKERAQYLTDVQISNLHGPVRSLTTLTYTGGSLTDSATSEFDHKGNLVRYVDIDAESKCYEEIYTNDASGNRVSEATAFGQQKPGRFECQNRRPWTKSTYTYVFNAEGLLTSRKSRVMYPASDTSETTTGYSYDSGGRLTRIECSFGTTRCFFEYSYENAPRGVLVRKRSYYSTGSITFDVTRELLYATDGRLLEATQSPPEVFGFGGSAIELYDDTGRLRQEKAGGATTNYENHDKQGNWTIRRTDSIREVRTITYY